jgi:amino acid transporter
LCFTRSASFISQIATIGFLLECIAISFAFLKLRKERPHLPRPYLIKYSTIIPFLVIIASTLLLLFVDFRSWLIALTFAILGLILHFLSYIEKERLKIAFWGMKILFLVGSVIVLGLIYILI